jgi:hypothetical protein
MKILGLSKANSSLLHIIDLFLFTASCCVVNSGLWLHAWFGNLVN